MREWKRREFGFSITKVGDLINTVDILFFYGAGALVEIAAYDDTENILPDSLAWRGNDPENTINGMVIMHEAGDGICIDNIRFMKAPAMLSVAPSISDKPSLILPLR